MKVAEHIANTQPSYIREILSAATAEGVISLAGGLPAKSQLPIGLMEQAIAALHTKPELFQYGETIGYRPLLAYLEELYQLPEHHCAMVATGSQQGLDLIARAYLNAGDGVAMEAPSYLGALQVFSMARANIHTVEQQPHGPDLEALETLFASGAVKMFYAVPDFHNPTGICWSLAVRKKVAQLCSQYGVGLIEDVPYRDLRFAGNAQPLVSSFCPDNALVLRSFSKIAAPGLRLGVVTGPKQMIEPLIKVKQASDLHSSVPMQDVLLALLTHPEFAAHIHSVSEFYGARYKALESALSTELGNRCSFEPVQGGMFVWLTIPACNPMEIARAAIENGVAVVPSTVFYSNREAAGAALRLNFSHEPAEVLTEAVHRLATVL